MIFGGQGSIEVVIRKNLDKPRGELTAADFEKVTELYLDDTSTLAPHQITDSSLKELHKLKKLTKLHLGVTEITDAGLKELAKLKQLTSLNLSGTQTTDAGLKQLAKWRWLPWRGQLSQLFLFNTKVTSAGVAKLKKAMPKCEIHSNVKE